ncbi:COG3650 family protein [Fortiea contorta]|uniref:COG3650 family protein n=1 Tax=Fortiea contorta TaxID=1892405 RepID=UPI000348390F|nr:hypothetical protein [Fortiea contorta]
MSCAAVLGFIASLLTNNTSTAHEIAQTARVENFVARGTEPFWNLTLSKSGIIYSVPDGKKQTFPYVTPLAASGRTADFVRVYQFRGRGNNTLIIKKVNTCSDGMSDQNYPYSATLILGNQVLEGCAEKK